MGKKIIRRIALAELQQLFYSPVAWMILIVFTFQAALHFGKIFEVFVSWQENGNQSFNLTYRLLKQGIFGEGASAGVLNTLYLFIPLLTMGLMSRELSSGSIKLLYSSPVRNSQIVLGKFLSMMIYGAVLLAVVCVFVAWCAFSIHNFDYPLALSCLLGTYLLICTYAAIGLFMSSLTSYQVVAAVATLAALSFFSLIGNVGQQYDFVRDITYWLSINGRARTFIDGLICSQDVLYFLIVTALFISLTILRLKAVRQKAGWRASLGKYAAVTAAALILGYLSSRPRLTAYRDVTATGQQTLTPSSRQIVAEASGGLTMTTLVNLDDRISLNYGLPRTQLFDRDHFKQYVRFKPQMEMKYVLYYTETGASGSDSLSPRERMERLCIIEELNPDKVLTAGQVEERYKVDLAAEEYRMVRLLERQSGERTLLRMFDDMFVYPREEEITAAFMRITSTGLPVAGFLQGHGERSFDKEGDRSYRRMSRDKFYRNALINNGFRFIPIQDMEDDIPAEVDMLIVADMNTPLTPGEESRLDEYIARGGNLFILADLNRQQAVNPVVARFGVRFLPGRLVVPSDVGSDPDFVIARPTALADSCSFFFSFKGRDLKAAMPGCLAMEYRTDAGFETMPLYMSDENGWNELQTADMAGQVPTLDEAQGEKRGAYPTLLALRRTVDGKEQRVLISGDADCLADKEINMPRLLQSIHNESLYKGAFHWLSGGKVPVDTRRQDPPDNLMTVSYGSVTAAKIILSWVLPALMLLACLYLWIRRRGR